MLKNITINKIGKVAKCFATGKMTFGYCPICERKTIFIKYGDWLRDTYLCMSCVSTPRQRAIVKTIKELYPSYKQMSIHESSPGGISSDKLKSDCIDYTSSQFFLDFPLGKYKDGIRCENLEKLTFGDNTFDMVITQDVFEHIFNPKLAFKEIERVLKPGGTHIFTVPYYYWEKTLVRARQKEKKIDYLEEKMYHGNPIDEKGSLVVTEWGYDFIEYINKCTNMETKIYNFLGLKENYKLGLDASFLEVFVSKKNNL